MRCCSLFGCVLLAVGTIACDEADTSLPDAGAVVDAAVASSPDAAVARPDAAVAIADASSADSGSPDADTPLACGVVIDCIRACDSNDCPDLCLESMCAGDQPLWAAFGACIGEACAVPCEAALSAECETCVEGSCADQWAACEGGSCQEARLP